VPVALFPSNASFPCIHARSASTSSFSRPAQRLLALQPAHSRSHLMTLSIGGFSRVVTFPTAPIATGRSDPCRKGFAPYREPCLSTAHAYNALSPVTGFLATVAPEKLISPELDASISGVRTTRLRRTLSHRSLSALPASTATRPTFANDHDTPLWSGRDGWDILLIWAS